MRNKIFISTVLLVVLFLIIFLFSVQKGAVQISLSELVSLFTPGEGGTASLIFWELRFPRIVAAIAVGGALSLAGVIMQSVFSNPLVEPYTLGLSGTASLGIALMYILKLPELLGAWVLPLGAFAGSMPILFFLFRFGRTVMVDSKTILLSGVMLSYICSSLVTLLLTIADLETMGSIVHWGFGSLSATSLTGGVALLLLSIVSLVLLLFFSLPMNALSMSESDALALGVPVKTFRILLLVLATILTAGAVTVGRTIGFVGLLVPHLIRILVTRDNRFLLPLSWLLGASLLLGADTFGRVVLLPREIPVGVITGIIGGFFFLFVVHRKKNLI